MMSKADRVLIFIDHFLPGYKAGGPVRSCANMIALLGDRFHFSVVTSDREYMADTPYEGIARDEWIDGELCPVLYASPKAQKEGFWKKLIRESAPDVVYINGIYSFRFSILPLWVLKRMNDAPRTIVAPRGMLAPGAMSLKPWKKRGFLLLARSLGLFKGVVFHATHDQEVQEVRRWVGDREIRSLPNLPPAVTPESDPGIEKKEGELKLISIARIAPEKNTLGLLELLVQYGRPKVRLDLYGPIYDRGYWEECKARIDRLPEGISVVHSEGIPPDRATDAIRAHHAFILFTKGENYGHAILEALLAGRPVLISDRTPWQDIEDSRAGSILPLEDPKRAGSILQGHIDMDNATYQGFREGAASYGRKVSHVQRELEGYAALLKG